MNTVLSRLSEAHGLIMASEPTDHGAILGALMGVFYLTSGVCVVGAVAAIIRRDVWSLIRPIEAIVRFFGWIAAAIVPVLAVLMAFEVVSRYVFSAPTFWAFEVSYMMMGSCFLLAIAFCLQMRKHIRVDFLYDQLSDKRRAVIDLTGFVVFLMPVVVWCSWGLFVYFLEAYKVNEVSGESAWNPVIWPFKFTFSFGFYLLGMQTVAEICKCFFVLMGRDVPPPKPAGGFE